MEALVFQELDSSSHIARNFWKIATRVLRDQRMNERIVSKALVYLRCHGCEQFKLSFLVRAKEMAPSPSFTCLECVRSRLY